jgi:hypothetical protein
VEHRPAAKTQWDDGIRHRIDDIASRSILTMVQENGSIKPAIYLMAAAFTVAAVILGFRSRSQ